VSVEVPLDDLAGAVAARRFGYLVTTADDGRAHVVALVPTVDGHRLRFDAGGRTCRNATVHPSVTVVFPPTDDDAFSLVVDGTATVAGDVVDIAASWAVRHRPAPGLGRFEPVDHPPPGDATPVS
jgi:hypothetical protein